MTIPVVHSRIKVCGPYVVTLLDWAPSYKWYIARLVVKNEHEKYTCCGEIGLRDQDRHHSRVNSEHRNWEGQCDHFQKKDNLQFDLL
jgi:Tat protein secretion system quality control protein TatD with DNase activity